MRVPGADAGGRAGHSQSLERGLAILASFTSNRPLLGTSELARRLGLSRSTTHRYLSTLHDLDYLHQDTETRKYRLGPRVLDLGFSAINSMDVREIAAPYLRQLSDETGYTVNLAILDGVEVVYVERCRTSRVGQREIDLNLHVGSRLPAYCTSLGKAMLAFLPDAERDRILDGVDFAQRGPNTMLDRDSLLAELARVRRDGFAVNNEELAYGLRSIAAPARDHTGAPVAAINLAVHRTMVSLDDLVHRLSPPLLYTATEVSRRIGYRSGPDVVLSGLF
jgi:IclR family transcriptional regulator, pca regulon regulatory protein